MPPRPIDATRPLFVLARNYVSPIAKDFIVFRTYRSFPLLFAMLRMGLD